MKKTSNNQLIKWPLGDVFSPVFSWSSQRLCHMQWVTFKAWWWSEWPRALTLQAKFALCPYILWFLSFPNTEIIKENQAEDQLVVCVCICAFACVSVFADTWTSSLVSFTPHLAFLPIRLFDEMPFEGQTNVERGGGTSRQVVDDYFLYGGVETQRDISWPPSMN